MGSDVKFVGKARRFLTDAGFEYAEGFDLDNGNASTTEGRTETSLTADKGVIGQFG